MTTSDPIQRAMIGAACNVLHRRAAALRKRAGGLISTIEDKGRTVTIGSPEASIAIGTADLLDAAADDVAALAVRNG